MLVRREDDEENARGGLHDIFSLTRKKKLLYEENLAFSFTVLALFSNCIILNKERKNVSHKYIETRRSLVRGFPFFLGFRLTTARIFLFEMFFFFNVEIVENRARFLFDVHEREKHKIRHIHIEHAISLPLSSFFLFIRFLSSKKSFTEKHLSKC